MTADLWWGLALFGAVVIIATLVNVVAPAQRPRLRRVVRMFLLYAATVGLAKALPSLGASAAWVERVTAGAEMFYAFTAIGIVAMVVFAITLPRLGLSPPTIAVDLIVGVAFVFAVIAVLANHGLDSTSALTSGAVVTGLVGLSMQQTISNILGGVALQLDGSIHEGDWIQLENGKQGKVRAIRWRHTLVETRDWSTIVVPNSQLLGNNITILGWREGEKTPQRMWVYFNIDFRHPPARVIQIVNDAIRSSPIENVAPNPQPNCVCMDFAKDTRDSFAYYAVRYWIVDLATDDPTNSRVRTRIYAALQRAGIPLAIPAMANLVEVHDVEHRTRHKEARHKAHLEAIRSVHLFRTLTEDELRTLAEGLIHVSYSVNETITRQGAVAHWLYILTAGEAEIRTKVDPDGNGPLPEVAKLVATLHAPDFFGEMGLMTGEPRAADVIAKTEVDCFRLGRDTFERVLANRPQIAEELAANMATRRVELLAARDDLDDLTKESRKATEREKILKGIKSFFGL